MKWIIALLVSVGMFFAGYYHAGRYVTDEDLDEQAPAEAGAAGEEANSDSMAEMNP